jgi:hypothetical protein
MAEVRTPLFQYQLSSGAFSSFRRVQLLHAQALARAGRHQLEAIEQRLHALVLGAHRRDQSARQEGLAVARQRLGLGGELGGRGRVGLTQQRQHVQRKGA